MGRPVQKRKAGNANIRFATRSSLVQGGQPVKEFRIWHAGLNTNENGEPDLFDEQAAKAVLAAQAKHGVRVQIDLEHLSLDDKHPNFDPDARGYCTLEVRRDQNGGPELWAVDVEWTPDGIRRLTEGTQLYASPAFYFDAEARPTRVFNIGLVAKPATDHAPLLAASERVRMGIDFLKVMNVAKLALEQVGKLKTYAEGGEVAGFKIVDLATFLGVDIDPGDDPAGFIAALKTKLGDLVAKLDGAKPAPETPDAAMPAEEMAAAKLIMRLEGVETLAAASQNFIRYRDAYLLHAEAEAKLARERQTLEANERKSLCDKLKSTHAEDDETIKDLEKLPIERLRARATKALERKALEDSVPNAGGKKLTAKVDANGLSERELKICAQKKIDPATYAEKKAAIAARSNPRPTAQQGS